MRLYLFAAAAIGFLLTSSTYAAVGGALSKEEMFILGDHYYKASDYENAVRWYGPSANLAYAPALNQMGVVALEQHRNEEAFHWFEKAAKHGLRGGQYNLAQSYKDGIGVEINNVEAYAWLAVAKANGYEGLEAELDAVQQLLDEATLEEAKNKAAAYSIRYAAA